MPFERLSLRSALRNVRAPFVGGALPASVQVFTLSNLNQANLEYQRNRANADAVNQWVDPIRRIAYAEVGVFLFTVILWCVWKNLSCKNAWFFRIGNQQSLLANPLNPGDVFTPGWSVGWHFVPVAHLWKPFQAMTFIRNEVRDTFKDGPIVGIGWTLWIVMIISSWILTREGDLTTTEGINNFNSKLMVKSGIGIAATIPSALVMMTITRAQQEKARALKSQPS